MTVNRPTTFRRYYRDTMRKIREVGLLSLIGFKLESRRVILNRWVIILASLAYIAGVSLVFTKLDVTYGILLAVLPLAVGFLLVMEQHLAYAPVAILVAAAYIPFSLPTGTGSRLVASLALSIAFVALWLLRMAVVERNIRLVRSPANLPVLGFVIASVISLFWGLIFRDQTLTIGRSFIFVQIASLATMVISPLILLLMGNKVHDVGILKAMAWIMISVGALGLIDNLVSDILPVNTQGLTSMWVIGLATALVLFDKSLSLPLRGGLLLIVAGWLYWNFVVNLSWVAGWLPAILAGSVIVFFRDKRLLLASLGVLGVYILVQTTIFQTWLGEETVISGSTRMAAWLVNWGFTSKHLLFGMGPAGYASYYMTYIPNNAMATHSNYIDVISQTGIVGTVFFLAMFGVLAWRGLAVYKRVKGRGDFVEALSVALLGGTAGCIVIMAFGDWLLPFAYTQTIAGFSYTVYSWLFMGAILSLDYITAHERKPDHSEQRV